MIPVILVSHDLGALTSFEDLITTSSSLSSKVRPRQTMSTEDVKKWLGLFNFGIVLFDHTLDKVELMELLYDCWSSEKPPVCAYFSEALPSPELRSLFAVGVEDCGGTNKASKFESLVLKIPRVMDSLSLKHNSVLVLEDLDSPRDIICALVQSLGFSEVVGVGSVDKAIEVLLADPFKFFCVISDINMPDKSGFTFVKEIRQMMSLSYLPVVILTSDPSDTKLIEALKCGVTGFLAKPPKKGLLKAELDKSRRIVALGKDPQIGSPADIRILEKVIKDKKK